MKAIVMTRFGLPDVLQLQEVAKPIPRDHEVLIRIHATTATAGDSELRGLRFPLAVRLFIRVYFGLVKPKPTILGQELAGEIEAVGNAVTRFLKGDRVVGWSGIRLGAYAEYACMPEDGVLSIMPSNITYEEAAPLAVGGLEAVHFLKSRIRSGQKILIVGAGGSIGTFAVQIAKYFGARVTGVDRTGKLEMLRSIGADQVVDYTSEDFAKTGEKFDVIYDVVGKSSFSRSLRMLTPNGLYLIGNTRLSQRIRGRWTSLGSRVKVILWTQTSAREHIEDLNFLRELVESGRVSSVIDRRFPLERAADAHRYVDTGEKKGNVVITVVPSGR